MEDLVVSYADTKVTRDTLAVGQTTKVWFSAAGRGRLSLDFTQKDNPMKGFKVEEFDPTEQRAKWLQACSGR